jgi:hypothetical protein
VKHHNVYIGEYGSKPHKAGKDDTLFGFGKVSLVDFDRVQFEWFVVVNQSNWSNVAWKDVQVRTKLESIHKWWIVLTQIKICSSFDQRIE